MGILSAIPTWRHSGISPKPPPPTHALSLKHTHPPHPTSSPPILQVSNPFNFRHITHLKSAAQFDDVGPCVVMATPSMLQSGVSRELFEAWWVGGCSWGWGVDG